MSSRPPRELPRRDRQRLIDLLQGKLSPREADKLEDRIEDEPALGEAWRRLQATRGLLAEIADAELPDVNFRQIDAQVRWRLAREREEQALEESRRRPWRLALAVAAALLCGLAAGMLLERQRTPTPPPSPVATKRAPAPSVVRTAKQSATKAPKTSRGLAALAIVLSGEVNVASAGGALEPLGLDRPLLPGDRVLTSASGRVTLQWADGTGVQLGPDAELHLKRLDEAHQQLALFSGQARFIVEPARRTSIRDRRFEVLAGNLLVRVVGTRFAVALTPEHTEVEVSRGKVSVSPYDPKAPQLETKGIPVAAGQRLQVPKAGGAHRLEALRGKPSKGKQDYLIAWRSLAHVLAQTGHLQVDSKPMGAELRVDAVPVGQTNLRLRGSRGRHLLELWRDDKLLRRHWVKIGPGKGSRVALQVDAVRIRRVETARLPSSIYRIVRRRAVQIRACYERRLKNRPHLSGQFELRFDIDRDGRVRRASVDRDTLADPLVGRCAESVVKRWRFPPGSPATLVYPFVFKRR